METQLITYAGSASAPVYEKAGYTFDGWDKPFWSVTSDETVTAQWTANTYLVIYLTNKPAAASGAVTGSTTASAHTYDKAQNLNGNGNGFALTGWDFAGWNTCADGSGTSYAGSQSILNLTDETRAEIILYAKWTAKTYSVVFDKQSGSGGTNNVTALYDHELPAATAPSRAGYTFGGYFTGTNGMGTKYYNTT